jgi:HCOMODA/2-hydroxy-3-carboxy-muconic semialdehyde decarboxylase
MREAFVSDLEILLRDLVVANRILANEGIVDALGHVSVRHPGNPDRFFLACKRSPELIVYEDLIEYNLDCTPVDLKGRSQYSEVPIHGAIYAARSDVHGVVHSHAHDVIPFGVVKSVPLRPMVLFAASLGGKVPVWDKRDMFGDCSMLVTKFAEGQDLAKSIPTGTSVLMRGHGSVSVGPDLYEAVYTAINLKANAKLQAAALALGEVTYMSDGEIAETMKYTAGSHGRDSRAWEYWKQRAKVEHL